MMDFRMEMQERIDAGMSDVEAYNAARDSVAGYSDFRDVFDLPMNVGPCCGPDGCSDKLEVCDCTCDSDCECKNPELTSSQIDADMERYGKIADWR